jgi:hypothetical protein
LKRFEMGENPTFRKGSSQNGRRYRKRSAEVLETKSSLISSNGLKG